MNYIDLNSAEVNATADNFSNSFGTESNSPEGAQQGGFFWSSTGGSNVDVAAIKAAKERRFDTLLFLEENNLVKNYQATDGNGATALHYLIPHVGGNPQAAKVFEKILNRPDCPKFINTQNREGCTALHTAVELDANDVAHSLVQHGADPTIADGKGRKVTAMQVDVGASGDVLSVRGPDLGAGESSTLNPLVKMMSQMMDNSYNTLGETETSGPPVTSGADSVDTDAFLQQIVDKYTQKNALTGGGQRRIRVGQRKLHLYSQGAPQQQTQLSRLINNQSNLIHERVIQKIQEIMKVDEAEARVVKAAIYHKVKNDNPNLSNLDRAIEMEKNTNKDFIATLDLEATRSSMKKHFAEKEKMRKEREAKGETPKPKDSKKKGNKKTPKPRMPKIESTESPNVETSEPVVTGNLTVSSVDWDSDSSLGLSDTSM